MFNNVISEVAQNLVGINSDSELLSKSMILTPLGVINNTLKSKLSLANIYSPIVKIKDDYAIYNVIEGPNTIAAELSIQIDHPKYPTLPIAVYASYENPDHCKVHIYHSLFALQNRHKVRDPLYRQKISCDLSPLVTGYHQALDRGSVDETMSLFANDATAREPSGDKYGEGYPQSLRSFFAKALERGPIKLNYHSFIEQDSICAAEYTCYFWGQNIPPQGGMEFWEKNSDNLFSALRIYDDCQQP